MPTVGKQISMNFDEYYLPNYLSDVWIRLTRQEPSDRYYIKIILIEYVRNYEKSEIEKK